MLYCLFLAGVNNRPRPTLVAGTWDVAWVLVATAGFWVLGGPAVLVGLDDTWRHVLLRGSFATLRDYYHLTKWPWGLLWAAYFLLVALGALWLLLRGRAVAVVYHIDAGDALAAVETALARAGCAWAKRGNAYVLEPPAPGVLEVTVAPALRSATLRWRAGGGAVRERFEAELARVLEGVAARDSPAAGWLLTVA